MSLNNQTKIASGGVMCKQASLANLREWNELDCLSIHSLSSAWTFLIVEVLAARVQSLQPSGYSIMITFIFCSRNVFACFPGNTS